MSLADGFVDQIDGVRVVSNRPGTHLAGEKRHSRLASADQAAHLDGPVVPHALTVSLQMAVDDVVGDDASGKGELSDRSRDSAVRYAGRACQSGRNPADEVVARTDVLRDGS